MILPPFDAEDDPANMDRGHRTVAGLLSEERDLWLEVTERELEHTPVEWWERH